MEWMFLGKSIASAKTNMGKTIYEGGCTTVLVSSSSSSKKAKTQFYITVCVLLSLKRGFFMSGALMRARVSPTTCVSENLKRSYFYTQLFLPDSYTDRVKSIIHSLT